MVVCPIALDRKALNFLLLARVVALEKAYNAMISPFNTNYELTVLSRFIVVVQYQSTHSRF